MMISKMVGLIIKDHEKQLRKSMRAVKTLFFLITMLFSLLLFSAPVLLILTDSILPSLIILLSSPSHSSSLSLENLSTLLRNYDFRFSLIDFPLLSIIRSSVILCVYCLCDGPRLYRGPYLGITTFCSLVSLVFVSMKASYVFCASSRIDDEIRSVDVALVMSSLVLAVGHIVVAYRTSCRERRKLLLYKIDIEAVSAVQKGFPTYNKILQQVRVK